MTRRVLITGAAKRLGRILALHLAQEGHALALHHRQSGAEASALATEITTNGGVAILVQADLSDPTSWPTLIDASAAGLGRPLDTLINNASVFDYDLPDAPDGRVAAEAFATNYFAPMGLAGGFLAQSAPEADNVVINILDQKLWNLNPDFASYTASKAALAAATTMLDQQLGPRGRAAAIAPGLLFPSFDQTDAEYRAVANGNLMKRPIDPNDVAIAAKYILRAPLFRGQVLHIDNGQRFVASARDVMFQTRP